MPSSTRSGWGRAGHRRAVVASALVLAIALGGATAAWATIGGGSGGYRMATVTRADIGLRLTVVGTVEPVSDASPSFQVAGKVATVTSAVGQQVTAGETLATLDTTALGETVSSDQSTLNADEARLAQDEASAASASSPPASSTTTTTTAPSHGASAPPADQATITADESTLTTDEAKVSHDQQQEAADLAQAQQACGEGPTTTTTTSTTTTTNPTNCTAALAQVSKDQQQVSGDQATVAKDEAALAKALGTGSTGTTGATGNSGAGTGAGTGQGSHAIAGNTGSGTGNANAGGSNNNAGSGSGGSVASSDTPQQIAADQAAIDTAQATLTVAQQALDEATLTSPINGTIVSVGITAGDTVSANSSTEVIEIIGTRSFQVVGTLSSTQVPSVKVGNAVRVEVDGVDGTIDGTVSQVGPVESSSSGYSYPVVVALPNTVTGLFAGSTANVVIATGAVAHVVAVPTSAVQTAGASSFVMTLSDGTLTRTRIKVGLVGDTYTQVLSGVRAGQSVVLADYSLAVPSSNSNTFGGPGGFGGGAVSFQRVGSPGAFGGG